MRVEQPRASSRVRVGGRCDALRHGRRNAEDGSGVVRGAQRAKYTQRTKRLFIPKLRLLVRTRQKT